MADQDKRTIILDALEKLLEGKHINNISVSEIAKTAGIGKGSIYYYFSSKEAILDALIRRNYEQPLKIAKKLASQTEISSLKRMDALFLACRESSAIFHNQMRDTDMQSEAFLLQKHIAYLITELKPTLAEIISQGIERKEIDFPYPDALAEIALIVISVELNNYFLPSTSEEQKEILTALVCLLEKGTDVEHGALDYLSLI